MDTISLYRIFIAIIVMMVTASGAETVWTTGYDVILQPDELTTSGNFTIKVVDFPSPVTGHRTVNDTIEPDNPISPFVGLELYYDIIDNPSPITTFVLTQGESYKSNDKEIKITLKSIPGPLSTVWIYQFYKPKVTLTIQTRSKPNLDISIGLDKKDIYVGDQLRISSNIKNVGNDTIEDLNININSAPELAIHEKLSIGNLNKGDNYTKQFVINAPNSVDTKDYFINVSVTGRDVKGLSYIWNKSSTFSVRNRDVKIYKNVRTTFYLKDSIRVILSISNPGSYKIENIHIDDSIPDKLMILDNRSPLYNGTLHWDILKIDPSNSITMDYNIKALEPGPYVLPKMTMNYTIDGMTDTIVSEEIGFRIFGPKVVLKKSIDWNYSDNDYRILNIKISARNIGNTFTKVDISDKLPSNMAYKIVSGDLNSTIGLYPDAEKTVTYSIKTNAINMNTTAWPPANATYYLDKFKFDTTSNEKELEISKNVPMLDISTSTPTPSLQNISVERTPNITMSSPKVVATLPIKVPVQMPEKKSIPGFRLYDMLSSISLIATLSILGKLRKMFD